MLAPGTASVHLSALTRTRPLASLAQPARCLISVVLCPLSSLCSISQHVQRASFYQRTVSSCPPARGTLMGATTRYRVIVVRTPFFSAWNDISASFEPRPSQPAGASRAYSRGIAEQLDAGDARDITHKCVRNVAQTLKKLFCKHRSFTDVCSRLTLARWSYRSLDAAGSKSSRTTRICWAGEHRKSGL